MRVSDTLDLDQDRHYVGLHLVCKRLLADDTVLHWHAKSYNRFYILSCSMADAFFFDLC